MAEPPIKRYALVPKPGEDGIRRFQLAQVEQGAQPPKMNTQASALRFFFIITLGRADLAHQLARTHYPRKLPRVLAREQVARLIEAAPGPGLKYKTALQAGGYLPESSSPEEFRAFLEQNISDWKQAARAAGITPN